MYLVLSAFTASPISLVATVKAFKKSLAILKLSAHVGREDATVHLVKGIFQFFGECAKSASNMEMFNVAEERTKHGDEGGRNGAAGWAGGGDVLHCTELYCTVLYCILPQCTVLCCTVLNRTVLNCTVLYCTVLFCAALYCTVLHCIVLHCSVLHCTILYCTVVYCAVL